MRRPGDLDDSEIERKAREAEISRGYREAAWRALIFAHRYRAEEGEVGGARERACIEQARVWRRAVHALHAGAPLSSLPAHPGLARAGAPESDRGRVTNESQKTG